MTNDTSPEWVQASRRFLEFIENADPSLTALRDELDRLVRLARSTAEPEAVSAEVDDAQPDLARWEQAAARFIDDFGPYDIRGEEGFVFDDIRDIAADLERSLILYDRGDPDALWEWRFGFEMHWGSLHATPLLHHLKATLPRST